MKPGQFVGRGHDNAINVSQICTRIDKQPPNIAQIAIGNTQTLVDEFDIEVYILIKPGGDVVLGITGL